MTISDWTWVKVLILLIYDNVFNTKKPRFSQRFRIERRRAEAKNFIRSEELGVRGGICSDVHFLGSGRGETLRKMVRRIKAGFS